jgi:hypothetical protein
MIRNERARKHLLQFRTTSFDQSAGMTIGQGLPDRFDPLLAGSNLEPVERLAHQPFDGPCQVERGQRILVDELQMALHGA